MCTIEDAAKYKHPRADHELLGSECKGGIWVRSYRIQDFSLLESEIQMAKLARTGMCSLKSEWSIGVALENIAYMLGLSLSVFAWGQSKRGH